MLTLVQFIKNYTYIILPALAAVVLILFLWNIFIQIKIAKIRRRNEDFFAGGKVKNLEELLLAQAKNLKTLDHDIQELFNISNKINNLALRGLFKVAMIRFNPFKDVGGDQSFAIALLNGKNNGLTISSLYTREGTRVYSKAITDGQSEKYPLTEEEKQAIEIAINNTPIKKTE
jgi:hypothetical protein